MLHSDLKRLDHRPLSEEQGGVCLFAVIQNEILRLPYFLTYYRKLGINHFYIIDNQSTDGSGEYLLSQPDCAVFYTKASFLKSGAGVLWLNNLIDVYGEGRWALVADADELLVYPFCETKPLPVFCREMEEQGGEGLYTIMLDMYSDKPIQDVCYEQGKDFLSACPLFDSGYDFVKRIGIPFIKPAFPPFEHRGGPRLRHCFPEQLDSSFSARLNVRLQAAFEKILGKIGVGVKTPTVVAPLAFKVPLIKAKKGRGLVNNHCSTPLLLHSVTGALLHFKYFQDFSARVADAVAKENHYQGSAEYKRYAESLRRNPSLSLAYEDSATYHSSDDLVRLGLMGSLPLPSSTRGRA